jgi:hypothetical protein
MSRTWKMCISQTIIVLGMSVMYLFSMTWLHWVGLAIVVAGCIMGQNILSSAELALELYKLNHPLDKS